MPSHPPARARRPTARERMYRRRRRTVTALVTVFVAVVALAVACSGGSSRTTGAAVPADTSHESPTVLPGVGSPAPGVTATAEPLDVYAHTRAGMFSPAVAGAKPLVYVPNLGDGTVSVIDPSTYEVIRTIRVGAQPQHVVPSWDLRTLWVNNNSGNSLTPLNPVTGRRGGPDVPVADPYNLYFTPDGHYALVMAEADRDIDFRDPHTLALRYRLRLGAACPGVNHADFSPDGSFLIATCEFGGTLIKVDLQTKKVVATLNLNIGGASAPQDIKIDPFGEIWYVADMNRNGLWEVDGDLKLRGFLPTGPETHGLYPSRDGRFLYVANRGGHLTGGAFFEHAGMAGSVSVVSFVTRKVVATWPIPGGGTPDMGNVSADGRTLWLSGRRSNVVYVFDTTSGRLITKIAVGNQPHGLCVWPLPGRYSLGHTGILR